RRRGRRGRRAAGRRRVLAVELKPEDPDRPGDVLDGLLAEVGEGDVLEPAGELVANRAGDADAARLGERLEARGDVDAVAEDVAILVDHVAEVDSDAELHPAPRRDAFVALDHLDLDLD